MGVAELRATSFEPGVVVGGKYRISRLVGTGGVGEVYKATHIELDTDVALKVLRPEMATRSDLVGRFQREARASVRLHSEHIARVHDVGTHEGQPYFVMEYLVGSDLARYARDYEPDTATIAELLIQACEGLAVAHARNVVHRDVKPENLFVVKDDSGWQTLKILDFGISKIALTGKVSEIDIASMRTEVMMGTPHYISPEQIRSTRDVDHRTDLWGLGVVLFEIASRGMMPFREDHDVAALIAEILEREHRSLRELVPDVAPELVVIVNRCLEKDPDRRYQNAAELAAALLPLAPKRARASAERASAAVRAAGLGDTYLRTSRPPANSDAPGTPTVPGPPKNPTPDAYAATLVGPAGGGFTPLVQESLPATAASSPASAPVLPSSPALPAIPSAPVMMTTVAPPPSRVPIVVVGAVAIAAIAAVVVLLLRERPQGPASIPVATAGSVLAPPATLTASTSASASAVPTPSAAPSASHETPPVASPAVSSSPAPPHRPFVPRPGPPPTATAKPPATPGTPLEIRHER